MSGLTASPFRLPSAFQMDGDFGAPNRAMVASDGRKGRTGGGPETVGVMAAGSLGGVGRLRGSGGSMFGTGFPWSRSGGMPGSCRRG